MLCSGLVHEQPISSCLLTWVHRDFWEKYFVTDGNRNFFAGDLMPLTYYFCFLLEQRKRRESASSSSSVKKVKKP